VKAVPSKSKATAQAPSAGKAVGNAPAASAGARKSATRTAGVPDDAGESRHTSRSTHSPVPSPAKAGANPASVASRNDTMPTTLQATAAAAKKDPKLANNWKTKTGEELSDAEVLAMPESEYMNDKQLAFFRHKLTQIKQDMHNNAGETTEHLREDTVVVPDPADRATIEEEHALELRTRDRERKLLKKIEQSIARIDAGDYGYCDETGEPIGVGRLIARPTATLSLEAQQRRELKQKMYGD
jgi:DnaK suppressor protein